MNRKALFWFHVVLIRTGAVLQWRGPEETPSLKGSLEEVQRAADMASLGDQMGPKTGIRYPGTTILPTLRYMNQNIPEPFFGSCEAGYVFLSLVSVSKVPFSYSVYLWCPFLCRSWVAFYIFKGT